MNMNASNLTNNVLVFSLALNIPRRRNHILAFDLDFQKRLSCPNQILFVFIGKLGVYIDNLLKLIAFPAHNHIPFRYYMHHIKDV